MSKKRELAQAQIIGQMEHRYQNDQALAQRNYELTNALPVYTSSGPILTFEMPRFNKISTHTPVIFLYWSKLVPPFPPDAIPYLNAWLGEAITNSIKTFDDGSSSAVCLVPVCIDDDMELALPKNRPHTPQARVLWQEELRNEIMIEPVVVGKGRKAHLSADHLAVHLLRHHNSEALESIFKQTETSQYQSSHYGDSHVMKLVDVRTDEFPAEFISYFILWAMSLKDPSILAAAGGDSVLNEESPTEENPDSVSGSDVSVDPIEQIKKLSELHEAGVLSDEEFQAKKQVFLDLI
tara:strand:- start:3783 stop:4664 length:882 start_codon:yes stop_codon:yes gene_type:complete